MVTIAFAEQFALSFEGSAELPHFDKISFRVKNKIFATLNLPMNRMCVKLSAIDQDVFCKFDASVIYPVPNAWGKQGWTLINLAVVKKSMFKDALICASYNVAPEKLTEKYTQKFSEIN